MKKSLLIFAAASAVAFAACNGGNNEGNLTPAQADSIANAKVDSTAASLKNQNDSAISAKANAEARSADSLRVIDSVIQATKAPTPVKTVVIRKTDGGKKGTTTTTTTTTEPATPTAPTNQDKKAARFNDDQEAKAKVQQSNTDAKASRFNKGQ